MNHSLHTLVLSLLTLSVSLYIGCTYDVTFIGRYKFADGIGRRSIGQIKTLKDSLKINFVAAPPVEEIADDIEQPILEILRHPDKTPGTVMVYLDSLTHYKKNPFFLKKQRSHIQLLYITIESTKAPASWIQIIQNDFDGVIVPDLWLVGILQESGVKKPIFVLPEICFLEDFLQEPIQDKPHYPFTFGVTATAGKNKNHDLLLEAFAAEFGNSPDVLLRIHNHRTEKSCRITNKIGSLGLINVIESHGPLSKEAYMSHMKNIDCYVLLSRGEGFSLTPREALALGRPCVLLNHTAHQTICNTGFVHSITPTLTLPHDGESYRGESLGFNYNCEVSEARKALRDVYEQYQSFAQKAAQGREWVRQYLGKNLKAKYLSMFKPKKVILGKHNEATDECLITDSIELFTKYHQYIVRQTHTNT